MFAKASARVFVLRDIEEMSIEHTAEVLDMSHVAVKARLRRARSQLRERLSKYFGVRMTCGKTGNRQWSTGKDRESSCQGLLLALDCLHPDCLRNLLFQQREIERELHVSLLFRPKQEVIGFTGSNQK